MFHKDRLIDVVKDHGVVWAAPGQDFELASGARSRFYIDFDRVMMTPEGAYAVVDSLLDIIRRHKFTAIGGPSSGADPIIGGLMTQLVSWTFARRIRGFKVRKEPKGRGPGAGEIIEGYLDKSDAAVVIEDVTTSGGSVLKAIQAVEARGAKVIKVVTLLDRLAGAKQKLAAYDFEAILTLSDLGIEV